MPYVNSPSQWGGVAKFFHWLMAGLIVLAIVLGVIAEEMPMSPAKLNVFIWHKSLGISVLALFFLRLGWRLLSPAPAPVSGLSPLNEKLADLGHLLLYGLMLLLPLSGWVLNSAADFPFRWFGWFAVPSLIEPDKGVQELSEWVHVTAGYLLILALLGHVVMALKHHFHGSNLLRRMLPASGLGLTAVVLLLPAIVGVGWYAANLQALAGSTAKSTGNDPTVAVATDPQLANGSVASAVTAPEWQVIFPQSQLGFLATYDAVGFDGRFKSFTSDIFFAEDGLMGSYFEAEISLDSVDTRSEERDMSLPGEEWFHTALFATARFHTLGFRALENGTYAADGQLTLKGIAKPVTLTFQWLDAGGGQRRLLGTAVLDRRDFNVGSGMWAADDTVGFVVNVNVDLLLQQPEPR